METDFGGSKNGSGIDKARTVDVKERELARIDGGEEAGFSRAELVEI